MERDEILKHRLADVRWPTVRIRNALINEWPEGTLGDLILTTRVEMLRVPNFGRRSFEKTVETLAEFGLAFADGSKPEKIADLCPDCGGPMIACRSAEGTRYFYCATLDSTRKKAGASAGELIHVDPAMDLTLLSVRYLFADATQKNPTNSYFIEIAL